MNARICPKDSLPMTSSACNPLLCSSRTTVPPIPSGSHWADRSFSLKPNKKPSSWLPASRRQKDGEKIQFRQRRIIPAAILSTEMGEENVKRLTYPDRHSIWGDSFCSFVWNKQTADEYTREIGPLKEEVRAMLLAETNGELEKLHLIDILERLGISYHYENEIDEILENIFNFINGSEEKNQYDLYNAALLFRILRQHGFDISSEIFKKFKDSNGTFKEELSNDPKGLLNLYEAAFVRRHEDDILEEALSFTETHLQNMASQLSSTLQKQVNHALVQPLHRGYARTEAYYNITFYEEDESRDDKLLKLAKLDFNLLQMLHKQELSDLMRWWKPIIANFDYARDRLIECYYTALGQTFEPQYSVDRIMAAKGIMIDGLIDDTFDAYGTLEELKLFTNAVERWNHDEIDHLPDYMKSLYETLLNLHQDYDAEVRKLGRSFAVDSWKRRTQELVRAYYKEATWILGGCIPSFEEYLQNGCISVTVYQMMPVFLFTSECATKETFEWLDGNPKLMIASAIADRLYDDTGTFETDKIRGQLTTGIECYMKQYGVSKEEAFAKFREMVEDAWKDMNEEVSRSSQISMYVYRMALNYTRAVDVFFRNNLNHYTDVEGLIKPQITSLLVNPIKI